jgi:integrase
VTSGNIFREPELLLAVSRLGIQQLLAVFAYPEPLHPNAVDHRFKRLIKQAGVPEIRFHDLRHTCATLMLANNVHPKIVQERLGHADVSMTLNRYSHVTMDMQRDAADQLDALIEAVE